MKGIALPIETLVILVLAIVVLVGVIAFFLGVFNPSTSGIQLEAIKNLACQRFLSLNCEDSDDVKNLDIDLDDDGQTKGDGDTLTLLCKLKYSNIDCRQLCNCP